MSKYLISNDKLVAFSTISREYFFRKERNQMVNIVTVTKDNLEQEHICCAIARNDDCQVRAKSRGLRDSKMG